MDIFSKKFELMCYVKDQRALKGVCKYEDVCEKFDKNLLTEVMVRENLIGYDLNNPEGLDWTEIGWKEMDI
jgi:hypothetical protein